MDLNELQVLRIKDLTKLAQELGLNGGISSLNKQELIVKILEAQARKRRSIIRSWRFRSYE